MAPFPFMDIWMGIEARRRLSQVLPDSMLEWWNQWELPGLVFISLLAQVLLTLLGNRRKYGTNKVNEWIVWCSYYLADKVPAFALGVISSKIGDFYNNKQDEGRGSDPEMTAFWVPFFLMHIGGPDSITAYSLEDNELWSRHLVGLVVRTTVTFYIIVLSWSRTSWISWLSLPMLGAGFVKYGERTWSLYSASLNHCRHSWLTVTEAEKARGEERLLHLKGFMSCFVSVFSDVVLDRDDVRELRNIFYNCSCEDFFSYMDFVHGFCYDMFFTKSIVTHTFWGIILRLITLITEAVAFICYAINFHTKHGNYPGFDPIITYMLLLTAVVSEILSIVLGVTSSEWTIDILRVTHDKYRFKFLLLIIKRLEQRNVKKRRWNSVAQCNFLTFFLSYNKPFGDFFSPSKLEKYSHTSWILVPPDLKRMLWENARNNSIGSTPTQYRSTPLYKELIEAQRFRIPRLKILEFHQNILVWHIVTSICYYYDETRDCVSLGNSVHSRNSKMVSDYMCYLLVNRRHMLPVGTGLLTLRDTYLEAVRYCKNHPTLILPSDEREAYKTLLQHVSNNTKHEARSPRIDRSIFRDAFMTANELLARQNMKETWKFLMDLWMEIINFGAAHCRLDRHAQEIGNGGEFISYVWYLQVVSAFAQQSDAEDETASAVHV